MGEKTMRFARYAVGIEADSIIKKDKKTGRLYAERPKKKKTDDSSASGSGDSKKAQSEGQVEEEKPKEDEKK